MDMLRIEDLSLSYGDKPVVQNLNLRVKKGQVVSIIGPNASGKSTILKSIAGIIKPVSGKIFIEEKDISKMDSKKLAQKVSILLQQNKTLDDMSIEELVYFGRYPHKKWFEGFEASDICFAGQNFGNPVRRRKAKSLDRYGPCPRAGYPFV